MGVPLPIEDSVSLLFCLPSPINHLKNSMRETVYKVQKPPVYDKTRTKADILWKARGGRCFFDFTLSRSQ